MLMHLKRILWILDRMEANVEEAEHYVEMACHTRHHCQDTTEWCIEMAKRHLEFNTKGAALLDRHVAELSDKYDGEMMGSVKTYIHERRAGIMEESVEIHVALEKCKV